MQTCTRCGCDYARHADMREDLCREHGCWWSPGGGVTLPDEALKDLVLLLMFCDLQAQGDLGDLGRAYDRLSHHLRRFLEQHAASHLAEVRAGYWKSAEPPIAG
jgi:hypothetical protein